MAAVGGCRPRRRPPCADGAAVSRQPVPAAAQLQPRAAAGRRAALLARRTLRQSGARAEEQERTGPAADQRREARHRRETARRQRTPGEWDATAHVGSVDCELTRRSGLE